MIIINNFQKVIIPLWLILFLCFFCQSAQTNGFSGTNHNITRYTIPNSGNVSVSQYHLLKSTGGQNCMGRRQTNAYRLKSGYWGKANANPYDIVLSPTSVTEFCLTCTTIGNISSRDYDVLDTHDHAIVSGVGDTHNESFSLSNTTLLIHEMFDYKKQPTCSIRVRSTDSSYGVSEKVLTIDVIDIFASPEMTASISNQTFDEDSSSDAITFTATDFDTSTPCSLTVTIFSSNQSLFPDDTLSYECDSNHYTIIASPAANAFGNATLSILTTDADELTASASLELTVTSVNDCPELSTISDQIILRNSSDAINLTLTDIETDPDSLIFSANSSNPTLVPIENIILSGTGSSKIVTITPTADEYGFVSITIAISDGDLTATSSFGITVNFPPTISQAASDQAVDEYSQFVMALDENAYNDLDAGASLSYTATLSNNDPLPDWLIFDPSTLTFSGTPSQDEVGTTTVKLIITDNLSASVEDIFTITINDTNSSGFPLKSFDYQMPRFVKPSSGNVSNTPQYKLRSTNGQVSSGRNQTSVYRMKSGYWGNANSNPYDIVLSPTSVPENCITCTTVGGLSSRDYDVLDTHVLSMVSGTGATDNETFSFTNTTLFVHEVFNYEEKSSYSIRMRSNDSNFGASEKILIIDVIDINEIPEMTPMISNQTFDEDTHSSAITYTVTDPESSPCGLTVTIASSNQTLFPNNSLSYDCESGHYTIVASPSTNKYGQATLSILVTDAGGLTASTSFDLTVTSVNDMPEISTIPDQIIEINTAIMPQSFTITDVETDPDSLLLSVSSSNLTLVSIENIELSGTGSSRTISITKTADEFGFVSITIAVSDGDLTATSSFALTVLVAPTISAIEDQSIVEDTINHAVSFTVTDLDDDVNSLTITVNASNVSIVSDSQLSISGTGTDRILSITPTANEFGVLSITLSVADGSLSATTAFALTVTAVNDIPVISDIADQTTQEDNAIQAIAFTITDIETDDNNLILSVSSSDLTIVSLSNIVISGTGSNRSLSITPAANESGALSITISVSDGSLTATTSFEVSITPVNDAPILENPILNQMTLSDNPFTYTIAENTFNNVDPGDTLSYTVSMADGSALSAWFTFEPSTRTFSGTPTISDVGMITIMVTATDSESVSVTDVFTIGVSLGNYTPTVANPIPDQSCDEDVLFNFTFASNTFDDINFSEGDTLYYTATQDSGESLPHWLNFIPENRTFTGTPGDEDTGIIIIKVSAHDISLASVSDTFSLTVININDRPVIDIEPHAITITENTSGEPIYLTLSDVEPGVLTVSTLYSNAGLLTDASFYMADSNITVYTIAVTANETIGLSLVITPVYEQSGLSDITLTVSDALGLTSSAVIHLVVSLNEPPEISHIDNQNTFIDRAISLSFQLTDTEGGVFYISGLSSDTGLLANENIDFTGTNIQTNGTSYSLTTSSGVPEYITLTLNLSSGLSGNSSITIHIDDSGTISHQIFDISVIAIFTEDTSIVLPGMAYGSVAFGDYDHDADLDILITGWIAGSGSKIARVYNNNANTFNEDTEISLAGIYQGQGIFGDIDNNGYLDILISGLFEDDITAQSTLYLNTNGAYTQYTQTNLVEIRYSALAFGDYDNDGDQDMMITGETRSGANPRSCVYKNTDGQFNLDTGINLTPVSQGSVTFGDYDNDSDLDILLTGYTGSIPVAKVYKNSDGSFIEDSGISLEGVFRGSAIFGDYDNDGDLDILLTGYTSSFTKISKIYKNNGGSFSEASEIILPGVDYSSCAFGDYDNDGDLDILLAGQTSSEQIAKLYQNTEGNFVEQTTISLPPLHVCSVAFGDYDNDNDLDILLAGYSESDRIAKVYNNNLNIINTPPSAPTSLSAVVSEQTVQLSWAASSDTQTFNNGLSYHLRIGSIPGGMDILSPMALPLSNGYRLIPARGDSQTLTQTIKALSDGTYYWSVQAIDTAFKGSAFSTESSFVIYNPPNISSIANQTTPEDIALHGISLTITDAGASSCDLTLTIESSNQTLLPNETITYTCSVDHYTMNINPVSNEYGTSTLSMTITDADGLTATTSFDVIVTAVNDMPILSYPYHWGDISNGAVGGGFKIWGTSKNNLFNVGWSGTILHYNGNTWEDESIGGSDTISDVWGSDDNNVYAVGYFPGYVLHYNGTSWTNQNWNTSGNTLAGIYGFDENNITVGGGWGIVRKYNGATWQADDVGNTFISSIWGTDPDNIYACGAIYGSSYIHRFNGTSWSQVYSGAPQGLNSIWGSRENNVYAVGNDGYILHYDGNNWTAIESGTGIDLYGVWGTDDNNVYVVGASGTLKHFDGTNWSSIDSGTNQVLRDIWGFNETDMYIVGNGSTMLHWEPQSITMTENTSSEPVRFTIADTEPGVLTVSTQYSNATLLTNGSISIAGSGSNYYTIQVLSDEPVCLTFVITPVAEQSGTSDLTLTLSDAYEGTLSERIHVIVVGNNNPEISLIDNQNTLIDSSMSFSFQLSDTEGGVFEISALSSDTNLLANEHLIFTGLNIQTNGSSYSLTLSPGVTDDITLTINPSSGLAGNSTITIHIDDNGTISEQSFDMSIVAPFTAAIDFSFDDNPYYTIVGKFGDYDNDGDLDIVFNGDFLVQVNFTQLFKNTGGIFSKDTQINNIAGSNKSLFFGDYDNDGDLDIFQSGSDINNHKSTTIYQNLGGNFSTSIDLIEANGSMAYGDYDNDGDLDIIISGNTESGYISKAYQNIEGSFQEDTNIILPGVFGGSVEFADIDNDNDLDLLLTGNNGSELISKIYRNSDGHFTEDTTIDLIGVYNSSAAFADYDNDGDLDLLLTGGKSGGIISIAYKNTGGSFEEDTGINLPDVSSSSVAFGDYDNDGDLDLLLTGSTTNDNIARLYENTGGAFIEETRISLPGVFRGSGMFGDYDNDHDLDILLTGDIGSTNTIAKIYKNNINQPNTSPSEPSHLTLDIFVQTATLKWTAASDTETISQTGLTYNLRIGSTPGGMDILSPMALPLSNGYRLIPARGHIQTLTASINNLADGTYYWSVQAIDTAFEGSEFASESIFEIKNPPTITPISNQTTLEDIAIQNITFTATDAGALPCSLSLSVESSNTTLIPNEDISSSCESDQYTLAIYPAPYQNGISTISIMITDSGGLTATTAFDVTVTAVNNMPIISMINNQSIDEDTASSPIHFTIADADGDHLTLSGSSSNETLVSLENISFSGSTSDRYITITPTSDEQGQVTINVAVTDGNLTATTSFARNFSWWLC